MVQNIQLTGYAPKMARIDNPVIGLTEEDVRRLDHLHDDALLVSIWVGDYNTYRVPVDNRNSTNIKFPTEYGVGEVRGDQVATRECYIAMLEVDDHQQTMCIEEL